MYCLIVLVRFLLSGSDSIRETRQHRVVLVFSDGIEARGAVLNGWYTVCVQVVQGLDDIPWNACVHGREPVKARVPAAFKANPPSRLRFKWIVMHGPKPSNEHCMDQD